MSSLGECSPGRPVGGESSMTHGTVSCHNNAGCRGEACVAAYNAYMREYQARRRANDPAFLEKSRASNRASYRRRRARA